jgi:hypothetical protein
MSARTRIKRPTTATPRKVGTRRYLHVSTDYRQTFWLDSPAQFVKVGPGTTYRRGPA